MRRAGLGPRRLGQGNVSWRLATRQLVRLFPSILFSLRTIIDRNAATGRNYLEGEMETKNDILLSPIMLRCQKSF